MKFNLVETPLDDDLYFIPRFGGMDGGFFPELLYRIVGIWDFYVDKIKKITKFYEETKLITKISFCFSKKLGERSNLTGNLDNLQKLNTLQLRLL